MTRPDRSSAWWLPASLLGAGSVAFALWQGWPLLPGWWVGLIAWVDAQGDRLQGFDALFGLLGVLFTVLGGLTIFQRIQSRNPAALARAQAQEDAERARALATLHGAVRAHVTQRIDGLLFTRIQLDLGRAPAPEAVNPPWGRVHLRGDRPAERLPAGRTTLAVFDAADRALLILGEPGAGKTVEALRLTRDLLDRAPPDAPAADRGPAPPVPVFLYLSAFAPARGRAWGSLTDWMAHAVWRLYGIRRDLVADWLAAGRLLPVLDGLDEVAAGHRAACAAAISDFYREHRAGLLVTCREAEYRALPPLGLVDALRLLPLGADDRDAFLAQDPLGLAGLHRALKTDEDLARLATSPLALALLVDTYRGRDADAVHDLLDAAREQPAPADPGTPAVEALRSALFDAWLEHAFRRKDHLGSRRFTEADTRRWLGRLAWELERRGRTRFLLEDLQPDWANRWGLGLVAVLAWGLFWFAAIVSGKFVSALGSGHPLAWGAALVTGATLGGLLGGLFGILPAVGTIEPEERLSWSWAGLFKRGLLAGVGWAILLSLFPGLLGSVVFGPSAVLSHATLGAISGLCLGLILAGLATASTDQRDRPNQGILTSARNGLRFGLLGVPLMLGVFWLTALLLPDDLPLGPPPTGLVLLERGLGGWLVGFLLFGGFPVILHYPLRLTLSLQRRLPLRLVAFCEHGVALLLLQRAGGGYAFIHRDLQRRLAARFGPRAPRESGP